MFNKSNTRIISTNKSVVVLRQLGHNTSKCRIFIDGIEKGNLIKASGMFMPEDNADIEFDILTRINDLAAKSEAL